MTVEDPYIFHYTFGHEYDLEGIPMVGVVGEWSLDKRRWTNIYPPLNLTPPPKCAGEATHVLTGTQSVLNIPLVPVVRPDPIVESRT